MNRLHADVVILGSGFGGSLLGAILAKRGLSTIIVDSARHPRFAIGESSTPAADFLLEHLVKTYDLAALKPFCRFGSWRESYPEINCGCKRGFTYFWHAGEQGFTATLDHEHELFVAANASKEIADTQWYRPDIDEFLALYAQQQGCQLLEETQIREIERHRPFEWNICVQARSGEKSLIESRFVVDTTGPAGFVLKSLDIPDVTDSLHTESYAVYSHFKSLKRTDQWLAERGASAADYPYPPDDSAVHHLFGDGWLWRLRFENDTTSVGFVSKNPLPQNADDAWNTVLKQHPELRNILGVGWLGSNSVRPENSTGEIASFPNQLFRTNRLQRLAQQGADEDWAALPFTVGFIDPMHSTGIAHTLSGVQRIAEAVLDDFDTALLNQYSVGVVQEIQLIDQLVAGCYQSFDDFDLFHAWSMLYFAAATTFEKRWSEGGRPRFLCADDSAFTEMVQNTLLTFGDGGILKACDHIRQAIEPWNNVGLFRPLRPNLYFHTAAEK